MMGDEVRTTSFRPSPNDYVYTTYCRKAFCSDWEAIQDAAQKAHIGLWSHPAPVSPWSYRRGKSADQKETSPQTRGPVTFHGNTSSHVFHKPGCRYYDCKNCTRVFQTRDEAIKAGYRPCGSCKP
ncbi:sunset domain-containing protein [Oleidesulfovibrio alaskensis]